MLRRCHHDIAQRTRKTISAICNSRPRIEEKPPRPENRPPPNNRPNRPAPIKPAASPRNRPPPGRLKKPPPMPGPKDGREGCAKLRLNGEAVPGAVDVLGGMEKEREPREPDENPPPMRASAGVIADSVGIASASVTAMTWTALRVVVEKFMLFPKPLKGAAHLTWADLPKSEAGSRANGCGAASRALSRRYLATSFRGASKDANPES